MKEVEIKTDQKCVATLAPNHKGKPLPVEDGKTVWKTVSGDATLIPASDGLSCEMQTGDTPGTVQVVVEADADMGEGIETISEIIQLNVGARRASNLGLTVSTPEDV